MSIKQNKIMLCCLIPMLYFLRDTVFVSELLGVRTDLEDMALPDDSFHFRVDSLAKEVDCMAHVDTSPTYLLFQTLLPLFWTLICMI